MRTRPPPIFVCPHFLRINFRQLHQSKASKVHVASSPNFRWVWEADRSRGKPRDEQPPLLPLLLAKLQLSSYGRRSQWGSSSSPPGALTSSVFIFSLIPFQPKSSPLIEFSPQLVQSQAGVTGAGLQQYTVTSPLMSQASTTQVGVFIWGCDFVI